MFVRPFVCLFARHRGVRGEKSILGRMEVGTVCPKVWETSYRNKGPLDYSINTNKVITVVLRDVTVFPVSLGRLMGVAGGTSNVDDMCVNLRRLGLTRKGTLKKLVVS